MMRYYTFLLLFCYTFFACSSRQPAQDAATTVDTLVPIVATSPQVQDSFARGKILPHITCRSDASQSYALYIPASPDETPLPVIYCFDPHGDGALPLHNYEALADAFHFILVGSNNSKNGSDWNTAQNTWNALFNDTKSRLPINTNRIYTLGFSGGAKVAGFIALQQSGIKGVIAAGAPLPEDASISNFNFSFTGMAGRGDMNMTDLVALNAALDKTNNLHRLILFDGKHAWPPVDAMRIAFAGLQLDAVRQHLIPTNDSLIKAVVAQLNEKVEKELTAQQPVTAQQTCTLAIQLLQGLPGAGNFFTQKQKNITGSTVYQQQLQAEQQLFAKEQAQKQVFQQQFQQGDLQYWTATINDLEAKAKATTAEGAMYQRLLAYLSLAFYSISNQLIQNNQNEAAAHFVTLYKMADPTNPEAWYFSAILNARSNNSNAAEADLLKAAENGFTDIARMQQQPEFQQLASSINFGLIENRMKQE